MRSLAFLFLAFVLPCPSSTAYTILPQSHWSPTRTSTRWQQRERLWYVTQRKSQRQSGTAVHADTKEGTDLSMIKALEIKFRAR